MFHFVLFFLCCRKPMCNPFKPGGSRNTRGIAKITPCIVNGKPVGFGKLFRQKPCHLRFIVYVEPHVYTLQESPKGIRGTKTYFFRHWFNAKTGEKFIYPVPEIYRFTLGNKISIACS